MAADVWASCEKAGTYGRTVTVKVKFADFRQVTRSRSFTTVIARHDLLRQASLELVRTLLPTAKGIRLLGVTVSNFDQSPANTADELGVHVNVDNLAQRHDATISEPERKENAGLLRGAGTGCTGIDPVFEHVLGISRGTQRLFGAGDASQAVTIGHRWC